MCILSRYLIIGLVNPRWRTLNDTQIHGFWIDFHIITTYLRQISGTTFIPTLQPTLRTTDHDLADENTLPNPGLNKAFGRIGFAISTSLMLSVMLVKFKVFRHGDKLLDRHPRSIVVTPFRCGFASFEQQQQRLNGTEPRNIHETIFVL